MRLSDDDAAADLSSSMDGSICFWRGQPIAACPFPDDGARRTAWLKQWYASAEEARIVASSNGDLLRHRRAVRTAITEAAATLQRVMNGWVKIPAGLKEDVRNSRGLLEAALPHLDATGDEAVPPGPAPVLRGSTASIPPVPPGRLKAVPRSASG